MKRSGKFLSAFLAVVMSASALSVASVGANAAQAGGTITVTSNVCDDVKCVYTEDSDQVTVTFNLQSDKKIINEQSVLTYDSSVLKPASSNKAATYLPVLSDGSVVNAAESGSIYFNSTSLGLYDFTESDTYFTVVFDIVGSGNTTVDLDVEVLTATSATNSTEINAADRIQYISGSNVLSNDFTFTASAEASSQGDAIYVAVPELSYGVEWEEMYFVYSSDSYIANGTKIEMEKTDLVYPMTGDISGIIVTNANWAVYKLVPTAEQAAAIDAASYTGFMNKTGKLRTKFIWANSVTRANIDSTGYANAKHSVEDLKGKTFVINDTADATNNTSYLGYWTSEAPEEVVATIYAASPIVNDTTEMGTMYFRYGTSSTVSEAERLKMELTDNEYVATGLTSSMLQNGEWDVYELGLTASQVKAIDACNYTAFASPHGADIRTKYTYGYSVTRANIGSTGYGSAKHTVAELNGKMFFITDSTAANTTSYTGNWDNYNAQIKTITLKVAMPTKVNGKAVDSMNLVYAPYADITTATVLDMTKTNESFTPDEVYTSLIADNAQWAVYEITVDANQYKEMAKAGSVAFATDDTKIRTRFNYSNNIFRAGVGEYVNPFDINNYTKPEQLDGATYVVCGASVELAHALNGYWVA